MKKTSINLALVIWALTGCAVGVGPGTGTTALAEASQNTLEQQFPVGKATREDVLLKLGPPNSKSKEAGFENWKYNYAKAASVAVIFFTAPIGTRKSATFFFSDESGVLQKVDFKTESQ